MLYTVHNMYEVPFPGYMYIVIHGQRVDSNRNRILIQGLSFRIFQYWGGLTGLKKLLHVLDARKTGCNIL
jgi:hypothetical protein